MPAPHILLNIVRDTNVFIIILYAFKSNHEVEQAVTELRQNSSPVVRHTHIEQVRSRSGQWASTLNAMRTHVQRTVSRCFVVLRQLRQQKDYH